MTVLFPLSSFEYAQEGGTRCPMCLSDNIEGREINIDQGSAWQECSCLNCHAAWNDVYALTGYSELERSK